MMFRRQYRCWLCKQLLIFSQHGICSFCLKTLPVMPTCCHRCGKPSHQDDCFNCLTNPPPWQHLITVSDYRWPLDSFIKQFKFQHKTALAPTLARLMLLSWLKARRTQSLTKPDLLISVPLHKYRHWRRGFNQAALIAKPLAHWIGCDWSSACIKRRRATPYQTSLTASGRKQNLTQAFSCHQFINRCHIMLFDDIVTTGSTITEISQLLLANGAASIQICCLCRTL